MLAKLNDNPESTRSISTETQWTCAELELLITLLLSYCMQPTQKCIVYVTSDNDRPPQERMTADVFEILQKLSIAQREVYAEINHL